MKLGFFRIRKSQLSSNLNEYYSELKKKFVIKKIFLDFFFIYLLNKILFL